MPGTGPHGELLFRNPLGAPWTVQRAGNQLRKELHRIRWPEPVTFRAVRSSYSSFLIAGGVPPAVVARQLGHTSSVTTELYYGHISESAVDAMIRQKIDKGRSRSGIVTIAAIAGTLDRCHIPPEPACEECRCAPCA